MAKVAMLADTPDRRISGQPTTSAITAATAPPASAPGNTGHSAAAISCGRSGRNTDFAADFIVSRAET